MFLLKQREKTVSSTRTTAASDRPFPGDASRRYNTGMAFKPDDTVCFCFHVTARKIENFCRIHRPRVPSQISECLSAGTGCGWCRPMLRRIHNEICGTTTPAPDAPSTFDFSGPSIDPAAYASARQQYLADKKSPK